MSNLFNIPALAEEERRRRSGFFLRTTEKVPYRPEDFYKPDKTTEPHKLLVLPSLRAAVSEY